MKEKFEVLVAGRSQHTELEVGPNNAEQLAEISLKRGISVILDLSEFTQDEASEFLIQYFTSLWTASTSVKQPYQIVLEEAHEFVPQGIGTPLKQILTRIALRGRKRGLGVILISQRSAKVEKDVLTQTSLLFLHKVVHPIDLKVYKELIPLPAAQVEEMVRQLQPGEAVVVYNHQVHVVHIRHRHTFHVGSTPTHDTEKQPKLRRIDEAMLRELHALIVNANNDESNRDERAKLVSRVRELEELTVSKDAEIQRLKEQVDLLSKLSISIDLLLVYLLPRCLPMPYQILCNGIYQKSPGARSGLSLAPSRCTSLHNMRDDIIQSVLELMYIYQLWYGHLMANHLHLVIMCIMVATVTSTL